MDYSRIDQDLLRDTIASVESGGSLPSLGELWDRVVVVYNGKKHGTLPRISKSVVTKVVKEWNWQVKTTAKAKTGVAAGSRKSGITVFVGVGEFKSREVQRGRGIGGSIESRPVICADKYNWILTSEKRDGSFESSRSFFPSFRLLFDKLQSNGDWSDDISSKVCEALRGITGKKLSLGSGSPMELGQAIDQFYNTSYCFNVEVFKQIFKVEAPEEEVEAVEGV